jgi:hypothetical protein
MQVPGVGVKSKYPKTYGPLTIYSWGWQVELFGWFLCAVSKPFKQLYISPDATPDHERAWLLYSYYPRGDW